MKILIVDVQGAALDWAMRCIDAGHEVKWFIREDKKIGPVGEGLVPLVGDWHPHVRWADMIFLPDNTMYLREVDAIRDKPGAPIVCGATQESAELELDRMAGQRILARHGIEIPECLEFDNYEKAIAHVKANPQRYVSKPCGDADKAMSYVSKSAADMVYMLERWNKLGPCKGPFILQDFIPGIEMAVGAWIGRNGFVGPWCENFEFKKLMDGDMGPNTGEQGTVLRYVAKSKLGRQVLAPLEDYLVRIGHTGYVDVNCIIDEHGHPWPLELTMRPGWPTFQIQAELHDGDPAEWMAGICEGRRSGFTVDAIACGVVMSIPDYPYSHITRKEVTGIPLYGLTEGARPHIHPCEMKRGKAPHEVRGKIIDLPCWVTAGDYVLVASGTGETGKVAKKAAYAVLKKLSMPASPMWRTDIGDRLRAELPKLQQYGYAAGMAWSDE
jgi:phosphoribosylamine--glycine ligase